MTGMTVEAEAEEGAEIHVCRWMRTTLRDWRILRFWRSREVVVPTAGEGVEVDLVWFRRCNYSTSSEKLKRLCTFTASKNARAKCVLGARECHIKTRNRSEDGGSQLGYLFPPYFQCG